MIANKVEELFNKIGKNHFDDEYCVECESYIVSLKDIKMLYDYIEQLKKQRNCVADKVDKTIEYIENDMPYLEEPDEEIERCDGTTYMTMKKYDTSILLKILKGE